MVLEGIYAATSALRVFSQRMNRSAHNLANASTPGFRPSRNDLATAPQGKGVQAGGSTTLSLGPLVPIGGPLDLAINGAGFFQFNDPSGGLLFSRNGALMIDGQGRLVDSMGRSLNPSFVVSSNATQLHVSPRGQIQAMGADGQILAQVQIETVLFGNAGALAPQGGNVFRATNASGPPVAAAPGSAGRGEIISGALQASGTDLARELVNHILDRRFFEANVRSMEALDQTLGTLLDTKG